VKAGRFKKGEVIPGQVATPAIDRVTASKPSAISTLGLDTPGSQTPASEKSFQPPESKTINSPSGVLLANGLLSVTKRTFVKSPSGVTIALRESHSSGTNTPALDNTNVPAKLESKRSSPLRGLADAIEVVSSVRGIGWEWGKGLYVAPDTRPLDRSGFLKATLRTFVLSFLALDGIESFLKLLPPFRVHQGGSLFFMTTPPAFLSEYAIVSWFVKSYPALSTFVVKYTVSTGIAFLMGLAIIAGFEMCYAMLELFCVGLLGHNPESWPPLFDHPWLATSLADFWGRRWHQTLRQTFFVLGGYPLQWIVESLLRPMVGQEKASSIGRMGLVLGTFTASGLFHGLSIYGMGDGGVDYITILYFTIQGVLLLAERFWRKITGKRVRGTWGRIWTYFAVLSGIEFCSECLKLHVSRLILIVILTVDSWSKRGLISGVIVPPFFSPTRLLLFPILVRLLEQ